MCDPKAWKPRMSPEGLRVRRRHRMIVDRLLDTAVCPKCGRAGFADPKKSTGRVHTVQCQVCGKRFKVVEPGG
jgi:transcription elongation factor Elf1